MSLLRAPVNSSDHVQGPDNAPVTLLEYGDYQCPHCGAAHPVVQRVQRYFSSRLRLAYRHFPLTEIHEYAEAAAETAEYAGFYGRFSESHDMLFENQDRLGLPLFSGNCAILRVVRAGPSRRAGTRRGCAAEIRCTSWPPMGRFGTRPFIWGTISLFRP